MDKDIIQDRADSLAKKINDISKKFDIAEEISGSDVIDVIETQVQNVNDISLNTSDEVSLNVVNLNILVEDFKFVRDTLQEVIKNGRKVLNNITLDLLDAEDEKRASLIMSFAELNNSITNNMKIYTQSYKQISEVLVNLSKLQSTSKGNTINNVTNSITAVNVNNTEPISTLDLIKQLQNKNINNKK